MFADFDEIDTPALLIEKSVLENNIRKMSELARKNQVKLRPHVKTHKIPEIAALQIKYGARGMTSAKLSEAEVMINHGVKDVCLANIIVGKIKIERLFKLSKQAIISVAVDSVENARDLSNFFTKHNSVLRVLIKVNVGFDRCGVGGVRDATRLAKEIENLKGLELIGVMSHAGQVYAAASEEEIKRETAAEMEILTSIKCSLEKNGIEIREISAGSTPAALSLLESGCISELRAGNYVYNDIIQVGLGSAKIEDCALSVLATVVSVPSLERAIIDAGSKSLALDIAPESDSYRGHGYICGKNALIERLSEEHGIISRAGENFSIGEKIRIIPNHACNVSVLHEEAIVVDGENIVEKYAIKARGKLK